MRRILAILTLVTSTIACSLLSTGGPSAPAVSTIVASTLEALTAPASSTTSPEAAAGITFASNGVSLVIPTGLASGATAENVSARTDESEGPWGIAPAFTRLTLQGYALHDKFFEPQIMVYPAQEYAAVNAGAAISVPRLEAILADPSAPVTNDVLPRLPFANAEQAIGAAPKIVDFKNGTGLRVLAEYAQYFATINNHDLFYHYEGLTSDGKYYVVTTLPINAGFLAQDSDPNSVVPPGGIPFPGYDSTDPGAYQNYYGAISDLLSGAGPDAFTPKLSDLDSLIESLQVSP